MAAVLERTALADGAQAAPSGGPNVAERPCTFSGQVTFGSEAEAVMVRDALAVDPELRPAAVTRVLSVEGRDFIMQFYAVDMRTLRAAVSTFCDLLALAARTLDAFGPTSASAPVIEFAAFS